MTHRLGMLFLAALLFGQQTIVTSHAGDILQSLPFPGSMESYVRALQLYSAGEYRQAARLAEATGSSRGLALAARATLAYAEMLDKDETRLLVIRHAEALARTAIDKDRNNAEAYRLLAICLGQIARAKPVIENLIEGLPSEAKDAIDRAMALEPNSPWVHAVLGGWHAEIVTIAGPIIAEQTLGASREKAKTEFETAIALAPRNPILHYEYAMALRRMGNIEDQRMECRQFDLARALPGRDAVERSAVAKAQAMACADGE